MSGTLGIVQACFHEKEFQQRARRPFGGQTLLEWVVRRMTDCQHLTGVIVLTCDDENLSFISELTPPDVPVFVSKQPDALGRFSDVLGQYTADAFVRIRGDNPFVDSMLIDRLVVTARSREDCDYLGYQLPGAFSETPCIVEWARAKAVHRAAELAKKAEERQDIGTYIRSRPEKFSSTVHSLDSIHGDGLRFEIDMEADWEHLLTILETLGPEGFDYRHVASMMHHGPIRHRPHFTDKRWAKFDEEVA